VSQPLTSQAFLVPAVDARINTLNRLKKMPDEDGHIPDRAQQGQNLRRLARHNVGALIISPTRELATQIANEALKVCTWHKDMEVRLFVGGMSRGLQLRDWRRGRKDIVVATPGRLRDLLSEPDVADAMRKADMLILDEADTLLEMGFSNDLNFIIDHLPKERQTFLFSATVSKEIAAIAKKSLKPNHQVIDCVPENESNVHLHVPQYVTALPSAKEQIPHILRLIAHDQLTNPKSKVILFLPTTKLTMLYATLVRELMVSLPSRTSVHEIHSRLDQNQRSRASDRFRKDTAPSVLITSDVSARGVDYPNVTRVIQIGVPSSADQYIHRVGRTGRGGRTGGRGDLVLMPWESGFVKELGDVPVKNLPAEAHLEAVTSLASEQGRDDYIEKMEAMEGRIQALLPSLDPAAIEEVYTSMIGYYFPKSSMVGRSTMDIYEGLKDWSTGAVGLPSPPHLSPGFLAKLGLSNRVGGGMGNPHGRPKKGGSRGYGPGGGGFRRDGGRPGGGFGSGGGGFGGNRGGSGGYGGFGDRRADGGGGGGYGGFGGQRSGGGDRGSRGGFGARREGGGRGGNWI
jgi:ATP-dependent RNA helicase MSS116